MAKHDYYEVLGLKKGATDSEIKQAYRSMALKWHPDVNKNTDAHEHFKEINEAYEILSNPQKKQQYDQFGHSGNPFGQGRSGGPGGYGGQSYTYSGNINDIFEGMGFGGNAAGGGFSDPFDIFESFFGSGSPFGRQQQRRSIYRLRISFEEAARGVTKEVNIEGKNKTIKIPSGVDSGMRIRFSDFDIEVEVAPSKQFHREGQDIYSEIEISYIDAILGTTLDVKTLDKNVSIRVKPGTQPNTVVRLRDFGLPHPNSRSRGDFYVVLKVKIPSRVSGKEKKLLEELR